MKLWQSVQDPSVTTMNGLRTFVRGEHSVCVLSKDLTQEQLKDTNRLYIHEKQHSEHKLKASIGVNSNKLKDSKR